MPISYPITADIIQRLLNPAESLVAGAFLLRLIQVNMIKLGNPLYDLDIKAIYNYDGNEKVDISPDAVPSINILADNIWRLRFERAKPITREYIVNKAAEMGIKMSINTIAHIEYGRAACSESTLFGILSAAGGTYLYDSPEFLTCYKRMHFLQSANYSEQPLSFRLVSSRLKENKSILDSAVALGVDQSTVRRFEIGTRRPRDPELLNKVCAEYKITPEEYLDLAEKQDNYKPVKQSFRNVVKKSRNQSGLEIG